MPDSPLRRRSERRRSLFSYQKRSLLSRGDRNADAVADLRELDAGSSLINRRGHGAVVILDDYYKSKAMAAREHKRLPECTLLHRAIAGQDENNTRPSGEFTVHGNTSGDRQIVAENTRV